MIKISSLVIAKNEEDNIARCIRSQLNCIDEIFVFLDDSSKDKTEEIIKGFPNVRYEKIKWAGYAETKNNALEKLTNNWVFWIDADEEIMPELSEEINQFKKGVAESSGYSVARRAYFLGKWIKHCGWYPGRVVRLFDRNVARFNDNKVHEGLMVDGKKGELKNDLNHYTDPTVNHYFSKLNNYTTLAARELFEKGKKAGLRDLLLRPLFMFVKMYILKRGFLDGVHGFILSLLSSHYVFIKYAKLWELRLTNKKREI